MPPSIDGWRAHVVALLAVALATLIRFALDELGAPLLYIPYFPAIVVAALLGGLAPGLIAVAMSAMAAWALPTGHGAMHVPEAVGLAFFALNGLLVSAVCERVRRADRSVSTSREQVMRAEADMRERERAVQERASEVLESISDGYFTVDRDWRVTYVNKAASAIIRLTPEQFLGQDLWEKIPIMKGTAFERAYRRAAEQQEVVVVEEKSPSGKLWFEARVYPSRGGIAVFFRDISARKTAELALKDSEERLRLGIEAGRMGTWDWDVPKNVVRWTDQVYALHGVEKGQFGGKVEDFTKLLHPDDAPRVNGAIDAALAGEGRYAVEFRVIRPSGEVRWMMTAGQAFFENGKPVRMLGATADITERRAAEAERDRLLESERAARADAERVNRIKDEFLANLSHELRTPLNAILGWAQILRTRPLSGEIDLGVQVIERSARAQAQLIGDLLDMSRVLSGKLRIDAVTVGVAAVVSAALESIAPAVQAKAITVERIMDPSAEVVGDPDRLQQVAWNLLTNAIKFTPRGGRVQLCVARHEDHVTIAVSDSGIGIQPDFLPYVFDRFRQADASTTREHGGLGLGLAIVKNLVELHGGKVRVASEGQDRGATFTVELPAPSSPAVAHGSGPRLSEIPLNIAAKEGVLRDLDVLVVDDDDDARELVRRVLESCGAKVRVAGSAAEALALAQVARPRVLVTDLGMPGEDGYALLQKVRALPGPPFPAIAVTAFARAEDRAHTAAAGFALHLSKPVEPGEMIAAVRRLGGFGH